MTFTGLTAPTALSYDSAGTTLPITSDYTAFFTHTNQVDCPLAGCSMLTSDCLSSYPASPDVVVEPTTYGLTGSVTNPNGYTIVMCY